jgi:hypothetical protein
MPYIEKRGGNYRIVFHLAGKRYRHALKTSDESVANSVIGGVERTIMLIEQRALQIPEGADVGAFILSGGQVAKPLIAEPPDEEPAKLQPVTLEQLRDKYVARRDSRVLPHRSRRGTRPTRPRRCSRCRRRGDGQGFPRPGRLPREGGEAKTPEAAEKNSR